MAKLVEGTRSPFQRAADGVGSTTSTTYEQKARNTAPKATDWAPTFIDAITHGCSIDDAATMAGVHWTMPHKRRKTDEEFKRAWCEAADIGTRLLEQEAARRAYHGVLEPVFYKGEQCGVIRNYSDTMMMFILKGRRPQRYRDGSDDGAKRGDTILNINIMNVDTAEPLPALELVDAAGNQQDHQDIREAASVP